jgi:hypothetical protein
MDAACPLCLVLCDNFDLEPGDELVEVVTFRDFHDERDTALDWRQPCFSPCFGPTVVIREDLLNRPA